MEAATAVDMSEINQEWEDGVERLITALYPTPTDARTR